MAKKIELTEDQIKDLKKLAKAIRASEQVKGLRARFKGFVDDNLDALLGGVEIDGLELKVKISKTLVVEEL